MKPRVFIASSVEGLSWAYAVQAGLEYDAECTVWSQGVFTPSAYPIEDLVAELVKSDFGVFLFCPDDELIIKEESKRAVRDNVLFELGLFMGHLSRKRTFIVQPRDKFHIPTDITGINPVKFPTDRSDDNKKAALGPACNELRLAIKKLGPLANTIEAVVSEMNEFALNVMCAFGKFSFFCRPERVDFDAHLFDEGVKTLRTLQCVRFELSDDGKQYAYHWTDLGKEVAHKYGYDRGPTAQRPTPESGPPKCVEPVIDENDVISILEKWVAPKKNELDDEAFEFMKVDSELNLPDGSASRLLETAVKKFDYLIERRGATTITFKKGSSWFPGRPSVSNHGKPFYGR